MTDLTDRLDEIEARAADAGLDWESLGLHIDNARTDVPQLVAAHRAVLSPDLDLADPPYAWETMDGWADGYETALGNARAAIAAALGVEP